MKTSRLFDSDSERARRWTVADALAVLQDKAGFSTTDEARIETRRISDRSSNVDVRLVQVQYRQHADGSTVGVSLPTSAQFRAVLHDGRSKMLDIALLHDARVRCRLDQGVAVIMTNGQTLTAVEVIPTQLLVTPSTNDWLILEATVNFLQARDRVRRTARDVFGLSDDEFPWNVEIFDFDAVQQFRTPLLKQIAGYLEDHYPDVPRSHQKIADALNAFGMRPRVHRTRRRRRGI